MEIINPNDEPGHLVLSEYGRYRVAGVLKQIA
jgi:hypothetical protein